ncbi:phosphatidylserine decarboxylase [Streptomyces violascens]|uniref:phosphatidylserine decarboxylase n=1 Tax=Streptomyces violascens TaxID=67381 RepID=UPI003664B0C5
MGLIFIESAAPRVGMVALVPVGMSEVSSVTITVHEGQEVKKADELGYFSYGGSDIVLVFQDKPNLTFDTASPKLPANSRIASFG